MGGTGVGVGDMGGAVAEIVATGVRRISWVTDGMGCEGSGVNTSTLNVQPEIKEITTMQNINNFFMASLFLKYRPAASKDRRIR